MPSPPIDHHRILREVRANRERLDNCRMHRFDGYIPENKIAQISYRMKCVVCGGEMGLLEVSQYVRGYIAAGGDPNLIWPGWR